MPRSDIPIRHLQFPSPEPHSCTCRASRARTGQGQDPYPENVTVCKISETPNMRRDTEVDSQVYRYIHVSGTLTWNAHRDGSLGYIPPFAAIRTVVMYTPLFCHRVVSFRLGARLSRRLQLRFLRQKPLLHQRERALGYPQPLPENQRACQQCQSTCLVGRRQRNGDNVDERADTKG